MGIASAPWCPMLGPTSFGHDGAGGQSAFADVQSGVGFAYLTNQMGIRTMTDYRVSLQPCGAHLRT